MGESNIQFDYKRLYTSSKSDGTRNRAFFDILVINRTIKYVSIFFVTN